VDAKVMQERATAIKTLSEASVNVANARKIAVETVKLATEMDTIKAAEIGEILQPAGADECERQIKDLHQQLAEKIRMAREKYGTRIVLLQQPEQPLQLDQGQSDAALPPNKPI
jgi:hypothetical protein